MPGRHSPPARTVRARPASPSEERRPAEMTRLTILAPAPRWLVPIAAAGVVVIVATAVVVALSSNRDAGTASAQPPAAAAAAAAVADPASPADSPGTAPSGKAAAPAREYLRAMTTAIAAAPTDTQTGSYAFVYVKMWAADDTLRPPWRQHHRHRGVRGTPLAGHRRLRPRHPDPPARRAQRSTARNRELRTRRLGRRRRRRPRRPVRPRRQAAGRDRAAAPRRAAQGIEGSAQAGRGTD